MAKKSGSKTQKVSRASTREAVNESKRQGGTFDRSESWSLEFDPIPECYSEYADALEQEADSARTQQYIGEQIEVAKKVQLNLDRWPHRAERIATLVQQMRSKLFEWPVSYPLDSDDAHVDDLKARIESNLAIFDEVQSPSFSSLSGAAHAAILSVLSTFRMECGRVGAYPVNG